MPSPVVLEGLFVRLEPLSSNHVGALLEAAGEDRANYAFTLVPGDLPTMIDYVQYAVEQQEQGWELPFVTCDRRSGRVVGSTRFLDLDYWESSPTWPPGSKRGAPGPVPSVAEIGSTWLASSAQRTAINTEAKLLMLTHAFETWRVHRVSLKTDARNTRSRNAIIRIGAQFEGVRRAHVPTYDGSIRDSAYFSIVAAEWDLTKTRLEQLLGRE